jgi:hypothetical protein
VIAALPYALLAFTAVPTVVIEWREPDKLAVDLVLTAVTAAWMLWMCTLHPGWACRPRLMAGVRAAAAHPRLALTIDPGPQPAFGYSS